MATVTVYIAKLDPKHTVTVNGVDITTINAGADNNGFVKVADIDSKLVTVKHNGTTVYYQEGEFVDGVFFTALHDGEYLTFRNGQQFISYK